MKILEVLEAIGTSADYADIVKKGLKIAMSNSPNNWEYKFQADKEIRYSGSRLYILTGLLRPAP